MLKRRYSLASSSSLFARWASVVLLVCALFLCDCTYPSIAQTTDIDSLKVVLQKPLPDTSRVQTLLTLAKRLYAVDPAEMDTVAHKALRLSERIGFERGISGALLQIGRSFASRGRSEEAREYVEKARQLATEMNDTLTLSASWHALGNVALDQAQYEAALTNYLQALRLREASRDRRGISTTLNGIGILYRQQRNNAEAMLYYRRSLAIDEEDNYRSGIASSMNNLGLIFQAEKQYDSASHYLRRSLAMERALGRTSGIAFSLNNLGVLYDMRGKPDSALPLLYESLRLKVSIGDVRSQLFTQNCLASALRNLGRIQESVELAQKTLDTARKMDSKPHIQQAAENLAASYKALGRFDRALDYTELAARYRDSLFTLDRDRDLSRLEGSYKLEIKQHENDRLRSDNALQQRVLIGISLAGLIGTAFLVFFVRINAQKKRANAKLQHQQKTLEDQAQEIEIANTALQEAHERSEQLLRNTLPASIAERLKAGETKIAERFENVSILFADIVGFTELASRLEPVVLVALLDEIFTAFDGIAARFQLEKIKTIGDAYMLVAGIPEKLPGGAEKLALAALAMQEAISVKTDIVQRMNVHLQVRIGIHTGAVVAGVIGTSKFAYDLWGDTVNIANRLESHGIAGQIQVSEAFVQQFDTSIWERAANTHTRRIIAYPRSEKEFLTAKDAKPVLTGLPASFIFEERGEVELKGKGKMKAYLLTAR
ncbi:MAG: hypothetical protein EAZ92_12150 [Candidatus Kapaibacterium sp.]|nr:MAG: hypothetical protein EAZ92_12150 [Candidatus Kapabacteria bacterium]